MNNPKLTSRMLKKLANRLGAGGGVEVLGVAGIERFAEAPERMHPKNIFPDCRSVISIIQPIPRSTYRGITEGTYWPNYTYYSYNRLNTLFRPMLTYEVARMIEDHGYGASRMCRSMFALRHWPAVSAKSAGQRCFFIPCSVPGFASVRF